MAKNLLKKNWKVAGLLKKNPQISVLEKKYKKFLFKTINIKHSKMFDDLLIEIKKMGKIYGLINNAGTVHEDLLVNQDEKIIKNLLDVNLLGPILLTKKLLST